MAMIESIANVGSGLLFSIFVAQPIIFFFYDIHLQVEQNFIIALYFTIISIFRGYIWRIFFHNKFYK